MHHHEHNMLAVACPVLQGLGLALEPLLLISRQGFIERATRGDRVVSRLRYRDATGRQRALTLPAAEVSAVEKEIQTLRTYRRARRRLAELDRIRRHLGRDRKALLAPLVAAHGLRFHGRTIRAPRWRVVKTNLFPRNEGTNDELTD
jgi:hypothetical protein